MTIMDRYVLRSFLSSYLILFGAIVALCVFLDVVFNLDEFTDDMTQGALGVLLRIADYHGYRLPLYFHMLGGIMMSVAAGFTFALMLKNNELTPLVAAGVPLQRLAKPVLYCSVVLVGLWLVNSEVVLPAIASKIARTYQDLRDSKQVPVQCVRDENNALLAASEIHAREGWLKNVYIIEPDAQGAPAQVISADRATYDPQGRTWKLERGTRMSMASASQTGELGAVMTREPIDEFPFQLAPEQIRLRQSSQWAELMSIRQMNAAVPDLDADCAGRAVLSHAGAGERVRPGRQGVAGGGRVLRVHVPGAQRRGGVRRHSYRRAAGAGLRAAGGAAPGERADVGP